MPHKDIEKRRAYKAAYNRRNRERWNADPAYVAKRRAWSNTPERQAANRRYRMELRVETLQAYGGECFCCQEESIPFLTLDHLENVGSSRGDNDGGSRLCRRLRERGWPQGIVRVACYNCNCGRFYNGGVCPHRGLAELPAALKIGGFRDRPHYSSRAERDRGNNVRGNRKVKQQAMELYGDSRCACCGESNLGFLTLDHITPVECGKGARGRFGGCNFYKYLRSRGWPMRDEIQVLCCNCNFSRYWNEGQCPHKGLLADRFNAMDPTVYGFPAERQR